MRRRNAKSARASALAGALLLAASGTLLAAAGEVTHLSGALLATKPDGGSRVLAPKSLVNEGDVLATAENTYARVKFSDGGEVTLRPNSRLKIEAYAFDAQRPQSDNIIMGLLKGGLRSVTGLLARRKPEAYRMNTPVATIGVRGTHYGALLCQGDCAGLGAAASTPKDGLHVDVAEGTIALSNQGGQTVLAQGSFGYVPNALTVPIQVPASQGITVSAPPPAAKPGAFAPPGGTSSPTTDDCVVGQ